jgi:choline dehydrogenase-like flavoprotein
MEDDANNVPRDTTLRARVCIVGAGAHGITLARELAKTSHSVIVLESGGFDFSKPTQQLYEGTNTGLEYNLGASRLRYFGGSTNHWAGQSRPLDPEDFEARHWVPNSGWPFTRAEVEPYYERAQVMCDLGPFNYDVDFWLGRMKGVRVLVNNDTIRTALFQIGPGTHFGMKYRRDIVKAGNIKLLLNANVVNVRVDGKRVAGVDVKTLNGNQFQVDADIVVLGLGGIENARLLLASRTQQPAGLGNDHDLVGRYFMDHALVSVGRLVLSDRAPDPALHFFIGLPFTKAGIRDLPGLPPRQLLGQLSLTHRVTRKAQLPNFSAALFAPPNGDETAGITQGDMDRFLAAVEGSTGLQRPVKEETLISGEVLHATTHFELTTNMEPTPYRDSRVTLTGDLDPLGVPRVNLHWAFDPDDYTSMERGIEIMAREIGRLGLGRIHRAPAALLAAKYGNHHMGTTRMHKHPKHGVVDAHGEVHGIHNLYVGGSSVYPSVGFSNPTLLVVALSLRMGDRLKTVLSK